MRRIETPRGGASVINLVDGIDYSTVRSFGIEAADFSRSHCFSIIVSNACFLLLRRFTCCRQKVTYTWQNQARIEYNLKDKKGYDSVSNGRTSDKNISYMRYLESNVLIVRGLFECRGELKKVCTKKSNAVKITSDRRQISQCLN